MGDDWKYICFALPEADTAVLFPPHLSHADVAERFAPAKPLSAGFVRFDESTKLFVCYGRSDSLKLGPTSEDDFYVNQLLPRERL